MKSEIFSSLVLYAIHIDDYFYPYPVAGEEFPDAESFERYGKPADYTLSNRNDWRRDNVNRLIQELKQTITATKPWVRFGVSPFGIYRNKSSDKHGSNTRGLQNYDDLFEKGGYYIGISYGYGGNISCLLFKYDNLGHFIPPLYRAR